jgi:hypothetical protein
MQKAFTLTEQLDDAVTPSIAELKVRDASTNLALISITGYSARD